MTGDQWGPVPHTGPPKWCFPRGVYKTPGDHSGPVGGDQGSWHS